MVGGASGWSRDDWCWCCCCFWCCCWCASWGVGRDWVFFFCGGDDDLCWMISSRRLVTASFERGLVMAVDTAGNVGDVDVLSIAVGPKCYDPPQIFFTPSGPSPPSGTLALPAPPVPQLLPAPQPFQPLPIQPATTPGSPMQVDPANVPLPPTTERTPDDQLWLPSDATALYQPPLVIHTQPPGQQHYSEALGGEPISPERSALRQSLSAMFNVPVPPHAHTRPASPMDAISESQSQCDKSCHSPSEPSIPLT